MAYAAVAGWGMAVPERVLTNAELVRTAGVDEEWVVQRTGIRERRIAGPDEYTSTLAIAAGRAALERAGVVAADLDLVVVATTTPDRMCPATAPVVHAALGAAKGGAFDLNAACGGFITALAISTEFVRANRGSAALVIGAEVLSRFVDWTDPKTCVLFGDGAGAAVLTWSEEPAGLTGTDMGADGSAASLITIAAGGSRAPSSLETVAQGEHFIRMNGPEVYRAAVRTMVGSAERAMQNAGLRPDDVDLLVCHQANQRIIAECGERLGFGPDRVFTNVERYGNTSAASVPIALCEAAARGRLRPGSKVVVTAVGAGLAWASGVVTWTGARTQVGDSERIPMEVSA